MAIHDYIAQRIERALPGVRAAYDFPGVLHISHGNLSVNTGLTGWDYGSWMELDGEGCWQPIEDDARNAILQGAERDAGVWAFTDEVCDRLPTDDKIAGLAAAWMNAFAYAFYRVYGVHMERDYTYEPIRSPVTVHVEKEGPGRASLHVMGLGHTEARVIAENLTQRGTPEGRQIIDTGA